MHIDIVIMYPLNYDDTKYAAIKIMINNIKIVVGINDVESNVITSTVAIIKYIT